MIKLSKKSKLVLKRLGALIIILIIAVYVSAVYRYGNFNPFASPNRVVINGFYFHNASDTVTFTGNEKPEYEISNIMDRLT